MEAYQSHQRLLYQLVVRGMEDQIISIIQCKVFFLRVKLRVLCVPLSEVLITLIYALQITFLEM